MKESRVILDGELAGCGGVLHLINETDIAPSKEAILRGGIRRIPAELLDVVKWRVLRKRDLTHGLAKVEEAGKWLLCFEEIIVARGNVASGTWKPRRFIRALTPSR